MAPAQRGTRLRVLVTRPQPSAAATAQRLRDLGHDPVVLPLMQAIPDRHAAARALKEPHAALAVTSAQALRVLQEIDDRETALERHRQTPIFCVGDTTAQAARDLGFSHIVTGPGDGAGLAGIIASHQPPSLLYLAGDPRAPAFETCLSQAHIPYLVCEIYRMQAVPNTNTQIAAFMNDPGPRAVLLYSRETAKLLVSHLGKDGIDRHDIRWLCLSASIADVLPAGLRHVVIAAKPDESSLLRLL